MDDSRRRMQEQFDAQAARHAEEVKKVYNVKVDSLVLWIMCIFLMFWSSCLCIKNGIWPVNLKHSAVTIPKFFSMATYRNTD